MSSNTTEAMTMGSASESRNFTLFEVVGRIPGAEVDDVIDIGDVDVRKVEDCCEEVEDCCTVEERLGPDVWSVPTVIVVAMPAVEDSVREDGIRMVDVADGRGEAKEPDIRSRLKNGEKAR